MKKRLIYGIMLTAIACSSCRKILNVDLNSENTQSPVTVSDYEEVLNTMEISQPAYYETDMMTDDIYVERAGQGITSTYYSFYLWAKDPWQGTSSDEMYNNSYKWITQMNLILEYMPTAPPVGLDDRRSRAIAQASLFSGLKN